MFADVWSRLSLIDNRNFTGRTFFPARQCRPLILTSDPLSRVQVDKARRNVAEEVISKYPSA